MLFDVVTSEILKDCPSVIRPYSLALILIGALGSILARNQGFSNRIPHLSEFGGSLLFGCLRLVGALVALLMFFRIGPALLLEPGIRNVMWEKLVPSVAIVIPMGAVIVNLLLVYGALDFVGTLMRPVMKPLFRLPGRSALDDLMSWLGPYAVGLYFTRKLFEKGIYNRREAYTVCVCFCTVSIGFVGVVASTLDILNLFPLIMAAYFVAVYLLAVILVRIWPLSRVPATYFGPPQPEEEVHGNLAFYFQMAWRRALERVSVAPTLWKNISSSFLEGILLSATILGMILLIGTLALLVADHTPLFRFLGYPLVPIMTLLGLKNPELVAQASIAGITEVYIPALLVRSAEVSSKFFVCVLSLSQIIFFSSVAPMMMEMFREVPIRFFELVALFFIRTALLVPLLALLVNGLRALGVF